MDNKLNIGSEAWREINKSFSQIKQILSVLDDSALELIERKQLDPVPPFELAALNREYIHHIDSLRQAIESQDPAYLDVQLVDLCDFADQFGILIKKPIDDIYEYLECIDLPAVSPVFSETKADILIPELIIPAKTDLLRRIKDCPDELFRVTPRDFEEIIAEIFSHHGFKVELTQQTRDGGKDIIAITENLGLPVVHFVECKRYAKNKKVDIGIVKNLYATVVSGGANKGVLVTSSTYTQDARVFADKHLYLLALREYSDVLQWINSVATKQ